MSVLDLVKKSDLKAVNEESGSKVHSEVSEGCANAGEVELPLLLINTSRSEAPLGEGLGDSNENTGILMLGVNNSAV